MQSQLELGQQEDSEHVDSLAHGHVKLADSTSEQADHRERLLELSGPVAVKASMRTEVADGLAVGNGNQLHSLDADIVSSDVDGSHRRAVCFPSDQLAFGCVEAHTVECHEVLHPAVLRRQIQQRIGRAVRVVSISERSHVDRAAWPGETTAMLL